MTGAINRALESLREGRIVLVFDADDREGETDMVIPSEMVTPDIVRILRRDAGGLICTTVSADIGERIGLPFLTDIFNQVSEKFPVLEVLTPNDIPYDAKSAFSITINHRKTFTGVTDRDRAFTINEFASLASKTHQQTNGWAMQELGKNFRAPGHVILLKASKELLKQREGHTELSTALMVMAGLTPSATICEMMGEDGRAMSKEEARKYAEQRDLVFLEGSEIIEAWRGGEWNSGD
jgi:3,4-dihydroxy 2-butanone 4-phosphate synthase